MEDLVTDGTPASGATGGQSAMIDEGVYGLSFEAPAPPGADCSASGQGLAVFRGGLILGSDPHGGVFRGRYHYDPARGEAVVQVRLAIPPHGVLLTGLAAGPEGAFVDVSGRFRPRHPISSAVVDIAGAPVAVELRFMGPLAR